MRLWVGLLTAACIAGCGNDVVLSRAENDPEGAFPSTPMVPPVAGPAIRVEISWAPDAELDLHVVAPGSGLYGERDCYPQTPCDPSHWLPGFAPPMDWGAPGETADNPRISGDSFISDMHGGPETFDLGISETGDYLAVAYFDDLDSADGYVHCDTETTVTMEIWIDGVSTWHGSHQLQWIGPQHQGWTGAIVHVNGETASVEEDGNVTVLPWGGSFPSAGC